MKNFDYIGFLLGISLFNGFQKNELSLGLENRFLIQHFSKGNLIYLQNEKALTMDIILGGDIVVQSIDENGNILSIVSLEKGDMLGGNLLFSNKNEYPMTVMAKTNASLFRMEKGLILKLCQTNEQFLINFLEILSDKALVLTTKINALAIRTIREKIMSFLMFESSRQKSHKIVLSLTKKELAEKFGVERPSLQRELKKMKDEQVIDYDAGSITLL